MFGKWSKRSRAWSRVLTFALAHRHSSWSGGIRLVPMGSLAYSCGRLSWHGNASWFILASILLCFYGDHGCHESAHLLALREHEERSVGAVDACKLHRSARGPQPASGERRARDSVVRGVRAVTLDRDWHCCCEMRQRSAALRGIAELSLAPLSFWDFGTAARTGVQRTRKPFRTA